MQLLDTEQHDQLEIINCDHPNNVEECCSKMFSHWLTVDPDATWDKLLNALETIDYNVLAKSIQINILQGKSTRYNVMAKNIQSDILQVKTIGHSVVTKNIQTDVISGKYIILVTYTYIRSASLKYLYYLHLQML